MGRLDPRRRRGGAVALRGRLRAARRADRAAARGGMPHLPLRHRRRPLRPTGHDRAGRAPLGRPHDPRGRRRARLSSHGQRPDASPSRVRGVGGGLRHLPRRGDERPGRRGRPRPRARARRRRVVQPRDDPGAGGRCGECGRRRPRPLHEHPPRLLGPGVHARGPRPHRPPARSSSTSPSRSTAASALRMRGPCATQGHACSSPAARSSPTPTRPRPTGASPPPSREPRAGARARRSVARRRLPQPDRRRCRRPRRQGRRRGRHRAVRWPSRGGGRARRRRRGGSRGNALRDDGALRPPRAHAAMRRGDPRSRRRQSGGRMPRPEPRGSRWPRAAAGCRRRGGARRPAGGAAAEPRLAHLGRSPAAPTSRSSWRCRSTAASSCPAAGG